MTNSIKVNHSIETCLEDIPRFTQDFTLLKVGKAWAVTFYTGELSHDREHPNLWYLLNLTLQIGRENYKIEPPSDMDNPAYGDFTPMSFHLISSGFRKCRCGACAIESRGYSEESRPYGHSHYRCPYGHVWSEVEIYD